MIIYVSCSDNLRYHPEGAGLGRDWGGSDGEWGSRDTWLLNGIEKHGGESRSPGHLDWTGNVHPINRINNKRLSLSSVS